MFAPMIIPPPDLAASSPGQCAAKYSQVEVSNVQVRMLKADAQTPDQATLTSPERSTPVEWTMSFPPEVHEWTPRHMRRFSALAAKFALGELTAAEQSEYTELTHLRRKLNHPRSGSEVARDYARRRAMIGVEEALQKYVHFFRHEPARR
jgi:hypothetical protein